METTRRQFLKLTSVSAAGSIMAGWGVKPGGGTAPLPRPRVRRGKETYTICPYDASGCGFIVTTEDAAVVGVEGDPDHPINRGSACSKGAGLAQLHNNDRRLARVLYRRRGGTEWEEKTWEWAAEEIAGRIKSTRDRSWIGRDGQGNEVNRTEAIASVGGAALDNEECYLLAKALRSLGLVYVEHQARL